MLISVSDYKHSEGVTQLIINVEEYFSVSYSSEKSTLCVIVVGLFRGQTGCDVSARFPGGQKSNHSSYFLMLSLCAKCALTAHC